MFFVIVTTRELRFLQTQTEVSQVVKTTLTLDPEVTLNTGTAITPNTNNSTMTNTTKSNSSSTIQLSVICVIFTILAIFI